MNKVALNVTGKEFVKKKTQITCYTGKLQANILEKNGNEGGDLCDFNVPRAQKWP